MRNTLFCAVAGAAVLAASCDATPPAPKAPPENDFSAANQKVLSVLPGSARLVFVIARPGHTLERIRAFKALVTAGPIGKKYIDLADTKVKTAAGFDLLDDKAWTEQGIDLDAPVAFAWSDGDKAVLVVGAKDGQKAATFLKDKLRDDAVKCEVAGALVACHDLPELPLAKDPAQSLWVSVQKNLDKKTLSDELLLYGRLDGLPEIASAPLEYFKGSVAAFGGLRFEPHVIRFGGGYVNPSTEGLQKYFRVEPNTPTLLDVADPQASSGLFTYSPKALFALAKEKTPPEMFDKAVAGFTLTTGLDLEKDVVANLTGELFFTVGKGLNVAFVAGTRDAVATGKLLERLDGLIGTALDTFKSTPAGQGISRDVEDRKGQKIYHYGFRAPEGTPGIGKLSFDLYATAASKGIVLAYSKVALDNMLDAMQKPHGRGAYLAALPPEVKTAYETTLGGVTYYRGGAMTGLQNSQWWQAMTSSLSLIGGEEMRGALVEYVHLIDIFWDSAFVFDVKKDGMYLDAWVNLP